MLIKEILARQSAGDHTAIIYGGETRSYRQLFAASSALARVLAEAGDIGHNIGIFLPNSIAYAVAYFAITLLDKVIVPIGIQAKGDEIQSTVAYCELQVIVTSTEHIALLSGYLQGSQARVRLLDSQQGSWAVINAEQPPIALSEPLGGFSSDSVAIMLHTSGTTSSPKRVMLTHTNLIENIRSNIASLGLTGQDRTLIALPMVFGYCNTAQFLTHLYLGASIVILHSMFLPKLFFEAVASHQVTNFTGVPSMLLTLQSYRYRHRYDLSTLRLICFGGGVMPVGTLRELIESLPSVDFVQTYGQTEAAPRVTALLPEDALRKIGSVGRPIPGVRIKIVDEEGQAVGAYERGEILVQGDNVMRGYYKRPDETWRVLQDGWLSTGDLAYQDAEGYVYLVGRKKNVIIRGGVNIYPEEIEELLLRHPAVQEARVTAEPHPLLGEVPVAEVVLQPGAPTITPASIAGYCIERLAVYKVPARVDFVGDLPKTVTGKIRRF